MRWCPAGHLLPSASDLPAPAGSEGGGTSELVRLAARQIIEEALESEAGDALGRDYYVRGAAPGGGYRNGYRVRAD